MCHALKLMVQTSIACLSGLNMPEMMGICRYSHIGSDCWSNICLSFTLNPLLAHEHLCMLSHLCYRTIIVENLKWSMVNLRSNDQMVERRANNKVCLTLNPPHNNILYMLGFNPFNLIIQNRKPILVIIKGHQ